MPHGGVLIGRVVSKNGVPIRLTDERWAHIAEEHAELADLRSAVLETVSQPERILLGGDGEHLAVREMETRERADDGFIITAFVTRRLRSLSKRRQLWPL